MRCCGINRDALFAKSIPIFSHKINHLHPSKFVASKVEIEKDPQISLMQGIKLNYSTANEMKMVNYLQSPTLKFLFKVVPVLVIHLFFNSSGVKILL